MFKGTENKVGISWGLLRISLQIFCPYSIVYLPTNMCCSRFGRVLGFWTVAIVQYSKNTACWKLGQFSYSGDRVR
jgi:hypothetical protein